MTDKTNTRAPAQKPRLTDEEIRSIWVEHGLDDEAVEDFARAIESALLSKLRAPVADERAAFETIQRGAGLNELYLERHPESGQYMWTATKEAWETWQARAALASAPVAGEALTRFCPECGLVGDVASGYRSCCPDGGSARMIPVSMAKKCRDNFLLAINRDAAPQASESVRNAATASDSEVMREAAWHACRKDVGTGGWTVAEAFHYRGFFMHGWRAALSAQPGAQKGGSDA